MCTVTLEFIYKAYINCKGTTHILDTLINAWRWNWQDVVKKWLHANVSEWLIKYIVSPWNNIKCSPWFSLVIISSAAQSLSPWVWHCRIMAWMWIQSMRLRHYLYTRISLIVGEHIDKQTHQLLQHKLTMLVWDKTFHLLSGHIFLCCASTCPKCVDESLSVLIIAFLLCVMIEGSC